MSHKVWKCPSCGCLNKLPQVDDDGADELCVACKFPVHISKTGKLDHAAIAPNS